MRLCFNRCFSPLHRQDDLYAKEIELLVAVDHTVVFRNDLGDDLGAVAVGIAGLLGGFQPAVFRQHGLCHRVLTNDDNVLLLFICRHVMI